MADKRIIDLPAGSTIDDLDPLEGVDISDVSESPEGTSVKWTWTTIKAFLKTYLDTLYDVLGSAATVQGNLDTHVADDTNPHSVTAAQAGADPAGSAAAVQGNLDTHITNPQHPYKNESQEWSEIQVWDVRFQVKNVNATPGKITQPRIVVADAEPTPADYEENDIWIS